MHPSLIGSCIFITRDPRSHSIEYQDRIVVIELSTTSRQMDNYHDTITQVILMYKALHNERSIRLSCLSNRRRVI